MIGRWNRRAVALVACVTAFAITAGARADDTSPTPQSAASATATDAILPSWSLRLPSGDQAVSWRGATSLDDAGGGAYGMLYPAPNVVGLLAAVATHAFIADSVKNNQKDKLRAAADQVLTPYRSVLDGFTARELYTRAAERTMLGGRAALLEADQAAATDRIVEAVPVFTMTQDQRALLLESSIAISKPGGDPASAERRVVRVVSDAWPAEAEGPETHWSADSGSRLREASVWMFVQSLEIAMTAQLPPEAGNAPPFRTFRYIEGRIERMERGQLVRETCGRIVIKTLRGALMSIPVRPGSGRGGCAEPKPVS